MRLLQELRLPAMCAPMSFASSLELTLACCSAGIIGGWQGGNIRDLGEFRNHLVSIGDAREKRAAEGRPFVPHAINLPASIASDPGPGDAKLKLCEEMRVPIIISSVGDPTALVRRVHDWGGIVIHDVTTIRHAEKAIGAGVDGLMLTCAGAGGHTGSLSPLAFIPRVRSIYDGLIVAGGGIASGAGIAAVLTLGADVASLGTRFIATVESGASDGHKTMIAEAAMEDILVSDAMNGVPANWIRQSLIRVGLDPDDMPPRRGPMRGAQMPDGVRPWRDIWSAGHSIGLIHDVPSAADIVERLAGEFEMAAVGDWRANIEARTAQRPQA